MAKRQTLENIDLLLAKWQTRLKRAVNAIDKLGKQRKRLAVRASVPAYPTVDSETTLGAVPPTPTIPQPVAKSVEADIGIPEFLLRARPDAAGLAIAKEIAERSKAKTRGRIATMKAKKAGDLKKMPLTGKAALAAIRG